MVLNLQQVEAKKLGVGEESRLKNVYFLTKGELEEKYVYLINALFSA